MNESELERARRRAPNYQAAPHYRDLNTVVVPDTGTRYKREDPSALVAAGVAILALIAVGWLVLILAGQ